MSTEPIARIITPEIASDVAILSWEQGARCIGAANWPRSTSMTSGVLWNQRLEAYLYERTNPTMSASLIVAIEDVLKHLVSFQVRIPNLAEARGYLLSHTDLLLNIEEICLRASGVFGEGAQLSLEVTHDPEIDWQELVLFVRQEEYAADILEKIDEIRFTESDGVGMSGLSGLLFVTTDFQPPQ